MGGAFVVVSVASLENTIALDQGVSGVEHVLRGPAGRQHLAAPVDNQDAERERVDRSLEKAAVRARRRQLMVECRRAAQVAIQGRGETSGLGTLERACPGAGG